MGYKNRVRIVILNNYRPSSIPEEKPPDNIPYA